MGETDCFDRLAKETGLSRRQVIEIFKFVCEQYDYVVDDNEVEKMVAGTD